MDRGDSVTADVVRVASILYRFNSQDFEKKITDEGAVRYSTSLGGDSRDDMDQSRAWDDSYYNQLCPEYVENCRITHVIGESKQLLADVGLKTGKIISNAINIIPTPTIKAPTDSILHHYILI